MRQSFMITFSSKVWDASHQFRNTSVEISPVCLNKFNGGYQHLCGPSDIGNYISGNHCYSISIIECWNDVTLADEILSRRRALAYILRIRPGVTPHQNPSRYSSQVTTIFWKRWIVPIEWEAKPTYWKANFLTIQKGTFCCKFLSQLQGHSDIFWSDLCSLVGPNNKDMGIYT